MNLYNLKKKKLIAKGKLSNIYVANCSKFGDFILKEFKRTISFDDKTIVKNELIIWNMLQNSYIVKFFGIYNTRTSLSFMFELCQYGDLENRTNLFKLENQRFTEKDLIRMTFQILHGLAYLHDLGVMHRDIEPSNILLKSHPTGIMAKICDFSYGYKFRSIHDGTKKFIGKPLYMAPEIYQGEYYHVSVDIWSLGCTLIELCNLKHPFSCNTIDDLTDSILAGDLPNISDLYSEDYSNFLLSMLVRNPLLRPQAKTLLKDHIFDGFDVISEPICLPQIFYDIKTYYEGDNSQNKSIRDDHSDDPSKSFTDRTPLKRSMLSQNIQNDIKLTRKSLIHQTSVNRKPKTKPNRQRRPSHRKMKLIAHSLNNPSVSSNLFKIQPKFKSNIKPISYSMNTHSIMNLYDGSLNRSRRSLLSIRVSPRNHNTDLNSSVCSLTGGVHLDSDSSNHSLSRKRSNTTKIIYNNKVNKGTNFKNTKSNFNNNIINIKSSVRKNMATSLKSGRTSTINNRNSGVLTNNNNNNKNDLQNYNKNHSQNKTVNLDSLGSRGNKLSLSTNANSPVSNKAHHQKT